MATKLISRDQKLTLARASNTLGAFAVSSAPPSAQPTVAAQAVLMLRERGEPERGVPMSGEHSMKPLLFGIAALLVTATVAGAADGCGRGMFYDGRRCVGEDGPGYGPPPYQRGYDTPRYERGYGPPVERGPQLRLDLGGRAGWGAILSAQPRLQNVQQLSAEFHGSRWTEKAVHRSLAWLENFVNATDMVVGFRPARTGQRGTEPLEHPLCRRAFQRVVDCLRC